MVFNKLNLSTQVQIGSLILSVFPIILIGILSYFVGRHIIIGRVQSHLESVAKLKKQVIESWANHHDHAISWIEEDKMIVQSLERIVHLFDDELPLRPKFKSDLKEQFLRYIALGHVSKISILHPDTGQIIFSSDPAMEGQFRANEKFFHEGKKGLSISERFLTVSRPIPYLIFSKPVKNSKGDVICVMTLSSNLNDLSNIMLERAGLSKTTDSLGLKIVKILVEGQLEGNLFTKNENGAFFKIHFQRNADKG